MRQDLADAHPPRRLRAQAPPELSSVSAHHAVIPAVSPVNGINTGRREVPGHRLLVLGGTGGTLGDKWWNVMTGKLYWIVCRRNLQGFAYLAPVHSCSGQKFQLKRHEPQGINPDELILDLIEVHDDESASREAVDQVVQFQESIKTRNQYPNTAPCSLCRGVYASGIRGGHNYGGASPPLTWHPVLRSLVRASLGTRVAVTPDALVIPLGKAAQDAVSLLAADGLLNPGRSLTGFPHPSGGNGHRVRQYAANREALAGQVARWAATTLS
jgi:hypothetical protein